MPEELKKEFLTIVCCYCAMVLDQHGRQDEDIIGVVERDSSCQSHGICPDCLLTNYPKEYLAIQKESRLRIKSIFKKGYPKLNGKLSK